jgi:hypothetical protein
MQVPVKQITGCFDPTESSNELIWCCVSASAKTMNQVYINSSPIHNVSAAIAGSLIWPIDADSVSVLR